MTISAAGGFGTTNNAFGTSTPASGGLFGSGASGTTGTTGGGLFGTQSTTGFGQPQQATGSSGFCKFEGMALFFVY